MRIIFRPESEPAAWVLDIFFSLAILYIVMDFKQLESEAFALPPEEWATLARRLLWSLEEIPERECDHLWGDESARRIAELDAGTAQLVPGEEVTRKARALLR